MSRKELNVPVGSIHPNPFQPRLFFEDIEKLAKSIAADRLLHKIVVRKHPDVPDAWQIVDGERRLRAIKLLQWEWVVVETDDFSNKEMATLALKSDTEHRSFNPIEVATGYNNLFVHFGKTQIEIAEEYEVSTPVVSNAIRLLSLPQSVQTLLGQRKLGGTHGKILCSIISVPDEVESLAIRAVEEDWSTRRLEAEVKPISDRIEQAEIAAKNAAQPQLLPDAGPAVMSGAPLVSVPSETSEEGLSETISQSPFIASYAREILKYIYEDGPVTSAQIIAKTGYDSAKVENARQDLFKYKLIEMRPSEGYVSTEEGEKTVKSWETKASVPVKTDDEGAVELTFNQKQVLKVLLDHPGLTIVRIAEETGIHAADVAALLVGMQPRFIEDYEDNEGKSAFVVTDEGAAIVAENTTTASSSAPAAPAAPTPTASTVADPPAPPAAPAAEAKPATATPTTPPATTPAPAAPKPAAKVSTPAAPAVDLDTTPMQATVPAHEADWLDEQDLSVATACAIARRFIQACEAMDVDYETMLAQLEARSTEAPDDGADDDEDPE